MDDEFGLAFHVAPGRHQHLGRSSGMNETCDRCGPCAEAKYRVYRDRELFLCGHCMNRHWESLCGQGWEIWPIGKHELRPLIRVPAQNMSQ
jgi:hypothetical protein